MPEHHDKGYIAVGDIHGCADQLAELFEKAKQFPKKQWVFLGNYIDKGPKPEQTIALLRSKEGVFLKGRHEDMLLNHLQQAKNEEERRIVLEKARLSEESVLWLANLEGPLRLFDPYLFVHAAIDPNLPIKNHSPFVCIWGDPKEDYPELDPYIVVHGSHRVQEPSLKPNCISLHTGAGSGGRISAVVLPEKIFLQSSPTPSREQEWKLLRDTMEGLIEEI